MKAVMSMNDVTRRRIASTAGVVTFIAALTTGHAASAEERQEACADTTLEAVVDERVGVFGIQEFCDQEQRPDGVAKYTDADAILKAADMAQSTPIRVSYVDGCYQDQLQTPDLQDCMHQLETFCGPGMRWIRRMETDTRLEENTAGSVTYGPRVCVDEDSTNTPGAGAESFDLNDVAELTTVPPKLLADNGGRGMRNAHTNFYTDADLIVQNTTLNGEPAMLRATPIEFQWNYGDGMTRTTEVAGSSQSDFNTQTATSHQYEETGVYAVTLHTVYMGEYSLDGGQTWIRIDGTITRESDPLQADIFRSVTRNVADDCIDNPSAWGCGAPGSDSQATEPAG